MNIPFINTRALSFFFFIAIAFVVAACGSSTPAAASPTPTMTASTTAPVTTTTTNTSSTPTQASTKPTVPLTAIRMLDTMNGWALTASSVLKTSDGGLHWTDVTPSNSGINSANTKGQFMNANDAWIAVGSANQEEGAGIAVLRTTNGGANWQSSVIHDPRVSLVDTPHFLDAQQGWISLSSTPGAGSAGSDIWHSSDGGQTWAEIASNKSTRGLDLGYITGISFQNANVGIAAGNLGAGGNNTVPSIARTPDGGHTWQTITLPHLLGGYTNPFNTSEAPVFLGNMVLLPVNVHVESGSLLVLYRSNDDGFNWVQTSVAHISANDTYVLDSNHAWATDTQSGLLYATANGGNLWTATSSTTYHLTALSFVDINNGWGVTSTTLLHTTDGGKTWQQISYSIQ